MGKQINKFFTLCISAFIFGSDAAPTTTIVVSNNTTCELELTNKQDQVATLNLPEKISPNSVEGSGKIAFSNGIFAPSEQQANAHYIVSCGDSTHLLRFDFFVGQSSLSTPGYFFKASSNPDAPFLVAPIGKISVLSNQPLHIILLDKTSVDTTASNDQENVNNNTTPATETAEPLVETEPLAETEPLTQ